MTLQYVLNVIDLCKFVQVWLRFSENMTSVGIVQHKSWFVLVQMLNLQDDQEQQQR